ncbi:hypothetical protein JEP40_03615 [Proteus vulgaris]|uniref:hypothetical protein n=1 Tax=Proteus vulgaris TaxID=585 RepID=UPI0018E44B06|nr:hypothetical protein [Proteus vulgaris]MBI6528221.1 hypothetical protein [Proteus vulgaris]
MSIIDSVRTSFSQIKATIENLDLKNKITDFFYYIGSNITGLFNNNVEYRYPVIERTIRDSSFSNTNLPKYERLSGVLYGIDNENNSKYDYEEIDNDLNKIESDYEEIDDYLNKIENDYEEIDNDLNKIENDYEEIDDYLNKIENNYEEISNISLHSDNIDNSEKDLNELYSKIDKKNTPEKIIDKAHQDVVDAFSWLN